MRNSFASQRIIDDSKTAKYWQHATLRSQKRWLTIVKAFNQIQKLSLRPKRTRKKKPSPMASPVIPPSPLFNGDPFRVPRSPIRSGGPDGPWFD